MIIFMAHYSCGKILEFVIMPYSVKVLSLYFYLLRTYNGSLQSRNRKTTLLALFFPLFPLALFFPLFRCFLFRRLFFLLPLFSPVGCRAYSRGSSFFPPSRLLCPPFRLCLRRRQH